MKTFKLTIVLFVLALLTANANAQNFGLTVSRGISSVRPDVTSLSSALNQGYSIGMYRYTPISKRSFIKAGFTLTSLQSNRSVLDAEGTTTLIPKKYTYVHLPIAFEKNFFGFNKITKSQSHYTWNAGVDFSYLMHENDYQLHTGSDFATRPLNVGLTSSFQLVKPMAWHSAFAIGPQIQAFTTGQDATKYAVYAGFRLDWKFGKTQGKKR
ncbi:MAG: hypothetical protein JXQ87_07920 [Bacteroidia bacterium]